MDGFFVAKFKVEKRKRGIKVNDTAVVAEEEEPTGMDEDQADKFISSAFDDARDQSYINGQS